MFPLFQMSSTIKSLKLLADPTRVRILILLGENELSVAELQEILGMGQSRISTHLSQIKTGGLVQVRRSGKSMLYSALPLTGERKKLLANVLQVGRKEIPETLLDADALELILKKRKDRSRAYFDELAGKFGRAYCPGRSWKGLAETLLKMMPPMVIADLGSGEGTFSLLLAQKAKQVIAIDNSEKMVEFAAGVAREHGAENLEFRLGDIESPPIGDGEVDVALLQPGTAPRQPPPKSHRRSLPDPQTRGKIVILDLLKHTYEQARDLYADVWLGFSEVEILGFLKSAGFKDIDISEVHKEEQHPYFQTLLALGEKP